MSEVYPAGPAGVPANLTKPSASYKRHAWLAVAGLLVFVAIYLSLAGWFCWTAYRLVSGALAPGGNLFMGIATGLPAALLAAFMLKALFFVRRARESKDIELTAGREPKLFEFLNRLADEAGAPRPHRVFLSPRVNAAVFYDLSVFNLFFPSKKNLEIGLGLVNVLNISEFKAVLAHEFGHFAQKSMAVGSWVYIAHQIAAHIVHQRDVIDSFLQGLSRIDLRVAWIGWLLRLVVWSIRSLLDTAFGLVVAAQRALSREMEFQADLVAVSLTGSDALVHALHKLHAADEAWDRAIGFANGEAQKGLAVGDIFAVQSRIIQKLGVILDDPAYGQIPPLPETDRQQHRVFSRALASPPKMWATHPENAAREENAKRHYIEGSIDERDAWRVFADAAQTRAEMSAHLLRGAELTEVPMAESLEQLNKQFNKAYLFPAFRGAYLGRSSVRYAESVNDLYETKLPQGDLKDTLDGLYPKSLSGQLERVRKLYEELNTLEGIRNKTLTVNGGIIRHRDRQIQRGELPQVIAELRAEIEEAEAVVRRHDRLCRSAHLLAARQLGGGWAECLKAQLALLHYADHTEAELRDAHGFLGNVVAVVTADGHVSGRELKRLLGAAAEAYRPLAAVFEQADQLQLGQLVGKQLEIEDWKAALGEFELPPPNKDNINQWMQVIDGWLGSTINALDSVRMAALEQLLKMEAHISRHCRADSSAGTAPAAPGVPEKYTTRVIGSERKRQTRLDLWDRFQTADGFFPGLLRFGVAAAIVGSVVVAGHFAGGATVNIYNGLAQPVTVEIAGLSARLAPFGADTLHLPNGGRQRVSAYTNGGQEIESFSVDTGSGFGEFVYNVAQASPLVEWTQTYGSAPGKPNRELGAPRWSAADADIYFDEPPESISSKGKGGTRRVLSGLGHHDPYDLLKLVGDGQQVDTMIRSHAEWDSGDSTFVAHWLQLAQDRGDIAPLLNARLSHHPNDVMAMRLQQDSAPDEPARTAVCERHRALADTNGADPNLQYLSSRCLADGLEKDRSFLSGMQRWPDNPWFNLAGGYVLAERQEWSGAAQAWQNALRGNNAFSDWIALDLARVLRLQQGHKAPLGELAQQSGSLAQMLQLEQGQDLEQSPYLAYSLLHRGELERAAQLAQALGDEQFRLLRLIAASDGAGVELVGSVQQLGADRGIDSSTVWLAWSQAAKSGRDPAPFEEWARAQEKSADTALAFLRRLHSGGAPAEAEKQLSGLQPGERGRLIAAGLVLLGDEAPAEWRQQAKALLFAPERPYFL